MAQFDVELMDSSEASFLASVLRDNDAEDEEEMDPQWSAAAAILLGGEGALTNEEIEQKEAARRKRRAFLEKRRVAGQKDAIQVMRAKVNLLQEQYEKLCNAADLRRQQRNEQRQQQKKQRQATIDKAIGHNTQKTPLSNAADPEEEPDAEDQELVESLNSCMVPAKESLLFLARETQRLAFENEYLKDLVEQNAHFQHVIRSVAHDLKLSLSWPMTSIHRVGLDVGGFSFIPFSTEQCYDIIRHDFETNVLQRRPDFADDTANCRLPMGWRGFASIQGGTSVQFQHTKVWPLQPQEPFDLSWKLCQIPSEYRRASSRPRSIEILQKVSDDILVFRRISENVSNGCINHSVYMMYRMRVDQSFLIGMVPLPLWGNGSSVFCGDPYGKSLLRDNESIVLAQIYALYEPEPVPSPHGIGHQTHTRLCRWGAYVCETEDDTVFWLTEMIDMLLRFESLLLLPLANKPFKV